MLQLARSWLCRLLQVVNRLGVSWFSRLFIYNLDGNCFHNLQQVCKHQVASSLIFNSWLYSFNTSTYLESLRKRFCKCQIRSSDMAFLCVHKNNSITKPVCSLYTRVLVAVLVFCTTLNKIPKTKKNHLIVCIILER